MKDWSTLRHVACLARETTGCLVKMRIRALRALFLGTMYDGYLSSPGGSAKQAA